MRTFSACDNRKFDKCKFPIITKTVAKIINFLICCSGVNNFIYTLTQPFGSKTACSDIVFVRDNGCMSRFRRRQVARRTAMFRNVIDC